MASHQRPAVTLKDVGRHAGVSQATAARALGAYGYVSDDVRTRVLAAAAELGYRRNDLARSMVTRTTHTLGLVVADIENPFFAKLARAVADVARRHGYSLLVANSDERLDEERNAVQVFVRKRVDGLIVAPTSTEVDHHFIDLVRHRIPLVLVDREVKGLAVDAVVADAEGTTYEAIQTLTALGHRRVGLVTASTTLSSTAARIEGYQRALAQVGASPDAWIRVAPGNSRDAAQQAAASLLQSPVPPTAIFATDSLLTAGAYQAVLAAGLTVPDHVSLIGFDDVEWMSMVRPSISVVDQPVYALGKLAAERLMARITADDSAPRTYRLPARLIHRGSCTPASELRA